MRLRSRLKEGVWQLHSFRLLMSASMVSIFGSLITVTAFPFIAISELDAGPAQLALLSLAGIIPSALLGSVAGVWVDRLSARMVMISADLASAIALVAIPLAWWADRLSLAILIAVALVTSIARLCFRIADRSMLPRVVGRELVESANATLSGGSAIAEAGGFSVGGLLVQLLSGPLALLVDAISFLGSATLLWRLPVTAHVNMTDEALAHGHWREELGSALRYLRHSRTLAPLACALFLMATGVETVGTVYFLYVNKTLGFEPGVLGFVFAVGGIGSLIGASVSTRATARFGAGVALIGSLVALGVFTSAITLAQTAGLVALLIMVSQQLGDAFWLYYESTSASLRQLQTPEAMLGRINGAFENIEFVGLLLGAGLGALLGETIGLRVTIISGAGLICLAAVPLALSPVRKIRRLMPEAELAAT
jgi:predicted MFS family arabinose efflux permease